MLRKARASSVNFVMARRKSFTDGWMELFALSELEFGAFYSANYILALNKSFLIA